MATPGRFLECIVAPSFEPDAFEWLTTKPSWRNSVRLVELGQPIGPDSPAPNGFDLRRVEGGLLVQDWDRLQDDPTSGTVATERAPTDAERADLDFAWRICSAVKSNAIVLVKNRQLLGVGAGQMSRLDSVRIAVEKAGDSRPGRRPRLRRLLPLPRRPRPGREGRSLRHHPARRLQEGRRNPGRLQRAQHGHDPDRSAAFPPLRGRTCDRIEPRSQLTWRRMVRASSRNSARRHRPRYRLGADLVQPEPGSFSVFHGRRPTLLRVGTASHRQYRRSSGWLPSPLRRPTP